MLTELEVAHDMEETWDGKRFILPMGRMILKSKYYKMLDKQGVRVLNFFDKADAQAVRKEAGRSGEKESCESSKSGGGV